MTPVRMVIAVVLLGYAALASGADEASCLAQYQAEVTRIGRDAQRVAAENPPGSDREAQRRLMAPVQEALKAAADRARVCQEGIRRATRAPDGSAAELRARECIESGNRQLTELTRSTAGRTHLTREEQAALRDDMSRITEARTYCMRRAR